MTAPKRLKNGGNDGGDEPPSVFFAVATFLAAATAHARNYTRAEQTPAIKEKSVFRDPVVWATVGIFLATIATAVVGYFQYQTLEKSDRTLRDTLETNIAGQRPFVTLRELKVEAGDRIRYRDPAQKYWSFRLLFENSGSTVTRHLKIFPAYAFNTPPGDITLEQLQTVTGNASIVRHAPIDPQLFNDVSRTKNRNLVLGPHATEIAGGIAISADFLKPGNPPWFIFGIATYDDIFSHEDRSHVTKFCYEVFGLVAADQTPSVAACSHWNCADDECKEDKEAYDAEEARVAIRR